MEHVLAAVRAAQPFLAERTTAIEAERRLPHDVVARLATTGAFRMLVPRDAGGLEVSPAIACAVIEAVAEADASCGWCVMIGATAGLNAAYLDPAVARTIFADPSIIAGGVFAPMGRAVRDGDDFILTGRWQWASGSGHCAWLGGGAVVIENGAPERTPNGQPVTRMLLFPAAAATLHDTWHVSGLCGTGSGDMSVEGLRVPASHTVSLTGKPVASGPLYAFPVFGLLALGVSSVATGIARGAINDLTALAQSKTPQGTSRRLAERANVQAALADATAKLAAARALVATSVDAAWKSAQATGTVSLEQRAHLRLAATHATRTAADVTRSMYDLGGGSSVFLSSPLQRRFRDAHVVTQHMMIAQPTYELAGRVLLGLPTEASLL
jgi:indole-3-acetate monooxygenase